MDITWFGHACFRLKGRDAAVLMDPCPKTTGYTIGRQQANIVTISHRHPNHSFIEGISGASHYLDAPGEYEIGGVMLTGVRTFHDDKRGSVHGSNTVFLVEVDEVRICHLGDLGHVPTQEQMKDLSDIDVLLVPVGGGDTIDVATASEVISMLEPKIIIPMHYATEASTLTLQPLDTFIHQMGVSVSNAQPKFTVAKAQLPTETQIVVLDPRK